MKITSIEVRNFRRLESVSIEIEEKETVYVGPNNSGKTSASAIFRSFIDGREFRVHDFSAARISDFEKFADGKGELPTIELDIWFKIDSSGIEFGRAFSLLPNLSQDFDRVGLRLSYSARDSKKLLQDYDAAYPVTKGIRSKTLFQYLGVDGNLKRHFEVRYFALEQLTTEKKVVGLDKDEGAYLLRNLLRVDFVDAQRNIDDEDSNRSNRLSGAFATFYRKNLEQAETAAEAHLVIDENNKKLSDHYAKQFDPLFTLIKGLGVPSINDRELRIISSLSPETALKGNTELFYVDAIRRHELPELYNGLGFKNLIYMAIQVRHFHSQWLRTPENRPLCQLIFIEEPEVHLHAQAQQTFISNIWKVIADSAEQNGAGALAPQLIVSTHSSHILDAVDFGKVRYFRRCPLAGETGPPGILNASEVLNLRAFKPAIEKVGGEEIKPAQTVKFLQRYLRLTHCDLFFADGAILVEGAVEKLLLPAMIEKVAPRLRTSFLTILEVGGAFAFRFEGLLGFLKIPYLVITDIDSVVPKGRAVACRADSPDARTSNVTLKKICNVDTIASLAKLTDAQKIHADKDRCVAFQVDIEVEHKKEKKSLKPRTLEEAIAHQNFQLVHTKKIDLEIDLPDTLEAAYQAIYERILSSDFKKTDFAMSLLESDQDWKVPNYIVTGLNWLEARLIPRLNVSKKGA